MELTSYLLVLLRADFLDEVGHPLALGNLKAQAVKEGNHLIPGTMIHHTPCNTPFMITWLCKLVCWTVTLLFLSLATVPCSAAAMYTIVRT